MISIAAGHGVRQEPGGAATERQEPIGSSDNP
jgi:hypothetical protein